MDLNDTGRRILLRHWRLIAVFIVLALGITYAVSGRHGTSYTASARLTLDLPDPNGAAEAQVIADTGSALASSVGQVTSALRNAHISNRAASEVASHEVSATSLGTSGVLQLSVSDRDPNVAARVANALAAEIIRTRSNIAEGTSQRAVAGLDQRISRLNTQVGRLDAQVESLNERIATTANPGNANSLRMQRDQSSATRNSLAAQVSTLQSERDRLDSVSAQQPQGAIVSSATPPTQADSTGRSSKMVLGLLIGIILGVGFAALLEALRPAFVGGESQARELELPLLRQLRAGPGQPLGAEEIGLLTERLRLAAETAHVRRICLAPVGAGHDVAPLAKLLDDAMQTDTGAAEPKREVAGVAVSAEPASWTTLHGGGGSVVTHPTVRVSPADFRSSPVANGGGIGLVLVSPSTLTKHDIADAALLLRVSPLPTLGLITYGKPRRELANSLAEQKSPTFNV
jgi:capsular polysaccharide biosynthesis protein